MIAKPHPIDVTLDELREQLVVYARQWIEWGWGSVDEFVDTGRLPAACLHSGRTGPSSPSLVLTRSGGAGGHRTAIISDPREGEVTLTWRQVQLFLLRERDQSQLHLF